MADPKRYEFLILNDDGTITGTNDESVARDLNDDLVVIRVTEGGESCVLDSDFEPVEIGEA